MRPLRIAFDVGGVLSKYPEQFRHLVTALRPSLSEAVEVHVISDMHPVEMIVRMLEANGFDFIPFRNIHSADYKSHGEACKAVLCEQLGIDILVDDFIGYAASQGRPPIRLLVMPDASLPYYADEWKTDGSEGDFGRRRSQ